MDIGAVAESHTESYAIDYWVDLVGCRPVEVRKEDVAALFIAGAIGQLQIGQRDRPVHEFLRFHGRAVSIKRCSESVINSSACRCRRSLSN
jgi:hypothetical protein